MARVGEVLLRQARTRRAHSQPLAQRGQPNAVPRGGVPLRRARRRRPHRGPRGEPAARLAAEVLHDARPPRHGRVALLHGLHPRGGGCVRAGAPRGGALAAALPGPRPHGGAARGRRQAGAGGHRCGVAGAARGGVRGRRLHHPPEAPRARHALLQQGLRGGARASRGLPAEAREDQYVAQEAVGSAHVGPRATVLQAGELAVQGHHPAHVHGRRRQGLGRQGLQHQHEQQARQQPRPQPGLRARSTGVALCR
mmetsp:Transcript_16935/g.57493  ORF Transcript_16935/g.57493 Transcript_16935/m.57493 type:complete len:253 (+) Transcript_16935:210-968(+)